MTKALKMLVLALAALVGAQVQAVHPVAGGKAMPSRDESAPKLSRRGTFGRISVQAGKKHFPDGAKVMMTRTRADGVKQQIADGLKKKHAKPNGKKRAKLLSAPAATEKQPKVLAMYDISIGANGTKWQPDAGDPVQVTVELDEPVSVTASSQLGVVHLADDGTVEELSSGKYGFTYNAAKTEVTAFWFSAEGFSVYSIVDSGEGNDPGRRVYEFYTMDFEQDSEEYVPFYFTTADGRRTYIQIVKSGETMLQPEGLPSPAGVTFTGWHVYDATEAGQAGFDANGYATNAFDFATPIEFDDLGEERIVLRTMYAHQAYVIFHDQQMGDEWPIAGIRRGSLTQNSAGKWTTAIPIADKVVTYDDSVDGETTENTTPQMIFRGWSLTPVNPGSTTDVNGDAISLVAEPLVITIDSISSENMEPVNLYPVFVNINWITYKAAATGEGATYIPPAYYYADVGTNSFPVPTRTGYTFNGWWTGTNSTDVQVANASGALNTSVSLPSGWGGYISNGNLMLNESVTVYGRWVAADTKYTIVVLQQSVDDDKDAADEDKTYDFKESYTITAKSGSTATVADTYKEYDFTGFYYRTCDTNQVVKSDGSTVLNVFYDRYKVTYEFDEYRYEYTFVTTCTDGTLAQSSSGTLYGVESDGDYVRLYYKGSAYRTSNSSSGTKYTGNVYTRSSDYGWYPMVRIDNPTMTGLYGQRLVKYDGYSWPTAYKWSETYSGSSASGTSITYLDAFNAISYPRTTTDTSTHVITTRLFYGGENGTSKIYHVMQDVYGNYAESNAVETLSSADSGSSTTFNFTDKFEGFTVYAYSLGSFTSKPSNLVSAGDSASTQGYDLYVYHARNKYTLTFLDSYNSTEYSSVEIYYGALLADYIPSSKPTPTEPTMQGGYSFTGWYSDQATSTRFNFDTTMPMANVRAFAGWETEWYLIQIDPNGGALASGQSLWFWEAYNGDPIEEYSTVTRSFIQTVDGTWFYAKQDRHYHGYTDEWVSGESPDRNAYYTTDPSDGAIVDGKRYSEAVNAFRYAGWYEVHSDGSETLYAFGQPVQHNTTLRLHWKQLGTYRLRYMAGAGTMSNSDENEETLTLLDDGTYTDNAEILVTRTAEPPDGYSFVGWKIRHADDTIYQPGQVFGFKSAYVTTGTDTNGTTALYLVLDAVYEKVSTLTLTLDANGGSVSDDAGALTLNYEGAPALTTNITDSAVTVEGLWENAYGNIGDDTGFTYTLDGQTLTFLGWNTARDGSGTHFDAGALVGIDSIDADENGNNVLYAEWGVKVYFDINNTDGIWNDTAWPSNCVWDAEKNMYYQVVTLNGCASDPAVPLTSNDPDDMFYYWGTKRYTGEVDEYDFSQTVTNGTLTLYAFWSNRVEVMVHAVDVVKGVPEDKDAWLATPSILLNAAATVSFENDAAGCVNVPEGYAYAFAYVSDSRENISESCAITNLFYNVREKSVYVTYADGTAAALPSDKEIYFAYFSDPQPLDIGYQLMETDGDLAAVSVSSAAPKSATVGADEAYDVASAITAPRSYASNSHDYFAYALGDTNATTSSQLHMITTASKSDSSRPALLLQNAWDGYRYSLDGGEIWCTYGFDAKLYVLYFDSQPTIVTLNEQTLGTASDMSEQFDYTVVVTEYKVITTESQLQRSNKDGGFMGMGGSWGDWYDYGEPDLDVETNSLTTVLSETVHLANGGSEAVTLMYASTLSDWAYGSASSSWNTRYRTNTRTTTETYQRVTITQTAKSGFTTTNDGVGGDQVYVYEFTVTDEENAPSQSVTFTNTHTAEPIELHVAIGQGGVVTSRDDLRGADEGVYTLSVTNGTANSVTLGSTVPDGFFTGDASAYCVVGAFYGRTNENGVVEIVSPVTSVSFAQLADDTVYGLYLNGDNSLSLGDYGIYYVYTEVPKVYYMKEGANGSLTQVNPITYNGNSMVLNGEAAIAQGETLTIAADGSVTTISPFGQNVYRVLPALDGASAISMNLDGFALCAVGATNTSAMDGVVSGTSLKVKLDTDGFIKWSADGETWSGFSGTPAIYVLYKEIGYDLTINVTSLASDADKAADSFTLTLTSDNLAESVAYTVSGYDTDTITPVNGAITLTVTNGSSITFMSMPNNNLRYTLVETLPEGYVLTNVTYASGENIEAAVENGTAFYLTQAETIELTNIKSYTVTFLDEDGTELGSATYPYGTKPSDLTSTVSEDPTKDMDATSIYRFDDWGPSVENLGSNTTYTAEYRTIVIPQVTQRGAETNLTVTLSDEQTLIDTLKTAGIDLESEDYSEEEANELLNTVDSNGMRRWENLVSGTDTNDVPLSTSVSSDPTQVTVQMAADPGTTVDLGYAMFRELRKYNEDGKTWTRVAGPTVAGNPAFNIELVDANGKSKGPTGLYRVYTLLVPDMNPAVTNEIPSTNIIGVLEVNSAFTNTIAAVPWRQLASDPLYASDITVSNHVSTANLSEGDCVYALKDNTTYEMWTLQSDGKWGSVTTVSTLPADANYSFVTTAADADKQTFARGKAVWLTRKSPTDANGNAKPFFLVGQYESKAVEIDIARGSKKSPAFTQIAVPGYKDIYINDLDWGSNPGSTDMITIPKGSTMIVLRWKNNMWGRYRAAYNADLGYSVNTFEKYEDPIPAGTGFWYTRRAGAFSITWTPESTVE